VTTRIASVLPCRKWRVAIDTSQDSPADIPNAEAQPDVGSEVILPGRSTLVLTPDHARDG
jgi:hypothetical protein